MITITIFSILPTIVCEVLVLLLALDLYHNYSRPRAILCIFMLVTTLLYTGHFFYFNHLTTAIPLTDSIYSFCNPAVYPLYFIYIEELTGYRNNRRRQLLYLLPSLLCFLTVSLLYCLMNADETDVFIEKYLYGGEISALTGYAWWQAVAHMAVRLVFGVQIPFVFFKGWKKISEFNEEIDKNYSSTDGKMLSTLKPLLLAFVIVSVISFLSNIIGREHFFDSSELILPSLTFSLLLLFIGYEGLHQKFTAQDMVLDMMPCEEVNEDKIAEEYTGSQLLSNIIRVVDEEKLYLQPNLKINDLAKRLYTNREYAYRAINIEMGQSFADFINCKRIEYATHLLEQSSDMLLTEVALKSGFSSTSAFYRNWKLFRHCSPRKYLNKGNQGTIL